MQQVGPVEFGEPHGQHYTAVDRRPTNQVSAWQAERANRLTRRHPCEDPCDETAFVEFKLNTAYKSKINIAVNTAVEIQYKLNCRPTPILSNRPTE